MRGGRRMANRCPVRALDPRSGEELARYPTQLDAAQAVGGTGPGIARAVQMPYRTYRGMKWRRITKNPS
jgi:hypothetical protein